jgi:hypothetical protein
MKKQESGSATTKGLGDRRSIGRHELGYYLRVYNRTTGRILGHTVNVSDQGFMLVSCLPVITNTLFKLRMVLPDEMEHFSKLDFDAFCHWCQEDVNPGYYDSGFSVMDAGDAFADISRSLKEYFSFKTF